MERLLNLRRIGHAAFELLTLLICATGFRCHQARNQSSKHPGCRKMAHEVRLFIRQPGEGFALGRCLECGRLERWGG